uniref:Ribosomal protein L29 n=1 Tax=Dipterosiphonia australica TaxID=2007208 RepID=A0A1Z1MLR6_9FLOR|nr:ribosomal protein L29 [Dipterosiphonia australica]ARW66876.1 ribosomal protein L29 [Dipterosiphonia australica]
MTIQEQVKQLKKELVILRIDKITKQNSKHYKVKQIQNKISQILSINHNQNN